MHAMLKPDAEYVIRAKANVLVWDESMSVTNADEIEDLGDDRVTTNLEPGGNMTGECLIWEMGRY
jgi:hypothetical protein